MTARSTLRPVDILRVGASGPLARGMRTALSALGVSIGIAALVGVLGLSESSKSALLDEIASLGTNLLTVEAGGGFGAGDSELPDTAPATIDRIATVDQVSAVWDVDADVYRNDFIPEGETGSIRVVAADENLVGTLNGTVADGRYLDQATSDYPNAVVGSVAAERLGIRDLDQPTYDADGIDTPHLATVTVTDGMLREDLDFGYRATPGDPSGEICILETFDGTALDPAWSLVELGDADQGQVALNGGTLELTSDGTSLFHSDDNAAWVYRPVQGDFRVETVVSAIVDDAGGDVRKACLMARQGTGPQDPRVMVCFIPHLPDPPVAALQFDVRHVEGSAEELATLVPNVFLPVALAIERQGNTFSVSYSRDGGSTWTEATGQLGGSVELDLPSEIYWGLAVSSYDPNITMTVAFEDAAVCQPSETNP